MNSSYKRGCGVKLLSFAFGQRNLGGTTEVYSFVLVRTEEFFYI